jgi:cell division cycle 14
MPRPVTPPMEDIPTPTTPLRQLVTSTASAAEVEAMLPPGQPRKTPTGKRVALEMLGDEDEFEGNGSDDSTEDPKANSKGHSRVTKQSRTISPSGKTVMKTATAVAGSPAKQPRTVMLRGPVATASKPVRASPRIQGLVSARLTGESAAIVSQVVGAHAAPSHSTRRVREEQVTVTRSRSSTQPQQPQRISRPTPSKIPSRKFSRAASPPALSSSGKVTPSIVANGVPLSRLPTLIPSKRTFTGKSFSVTTTVPTTKCQGLSTVSDGDSASLNGMPKAPGEEDKEQEDAWMSGADAMAAVEPGTKPGSRPSIQRVRRRRSSFSSVDINV